MTLNGVVVILRYLTECVTFESKVRQTVCRQTPCWCDKNVQRMSAL